MHKEAVHELHIKLKETRKDIEIGKEDLEMKIKQVQREKKELEKEVKKLQQYQQSGGLTAAFVGGD